ncbi:TetR/AcrR family transcriptional regulator [Pedobacter nutrimenti]|jgi:TetR/AcrR family transcriptional repressor of mexJK operon|uniref:TetR family transcriptional regulator n=1 Tax=Pedobacter nutrimenti TaxID=1241337 RepID=A0A318U888_9SPHI|nr:TetR/AcrR family transcriptional regulator [Pedobacter nutrimenti]PYF70675.1 TetR family transcriptional regulator [Pedobacter nutrimenti]
MIIKDEKKELIIETAIKRFRHYGIQKTTMSDIADDLSLSKPSLYYYFPDKNNLTIEVMNKVCSEYHFHLEKVHQPELSLENNLYNVIELRHQYFKKYYMLYWVNLTLFMNAQELRPLFLKIRKRDLAFYTDLFSAAVQKGEIAPLDSKEIAQLYTESLTGIIVSAMKEGNKTFLPSKEELKTLLENLHQLSGLFIKGLK